MSSASRGAFILFEGIDRCGKSTQVKMLQEYLTRTRRAEAIRFPNRESHIGQLINSYLSSASNLSDHTIHLLFSANRWESASEIEEKLNAGITLICDRYAYSGVAFSSAKGMDMSWCKSCDVGLPAPDCIVYFDMPVDNAAKRGSYGEERYEKLDFQRVVQQQFARLQEEDEKPENAASSPSWVKVDAERSIEDVHAEVTQIAERIVHLVGDKPIQKLWKQE